MKTAVIFPWAGDNPHRAIAFEWVKGWHRINHPQWELVTGFAQSGEKWCKAEAVADALKKTDAELLVVIDADCVAPGVAHAVQAVRDGALWAIPHLRVLRFNEQATARIVAGADPRSLGATMDDFDQPPYKGMEGGGAVVLKRETYLKVPLDPRFKGWGQEDQSWAIALRVLCGKAWRTPVDPLWHLWHPPQARESRSRGSHKSWHLYNAYCRGALPRDMPGILADARALVN